MTQEGGSSRPFTALRRLVDLLETECAMLMQPDIPTAELTEVTNAKSAVLAELRATSDHSPAATDPGWLEMARAASRSNCRNGRIVAARKRSNRRILDFLAHGDDCGLYDQRGCVGKPQHGLVADA